MRRGALPNGVCLLNGVFGKVPEEGSANVASAGGRIGGDSAQRRQTYGVLGVVVSVVSWPIDAGPRRLSPMLLIPTEHYGFWSEKPGSIERGLFSVDGATRQQGTI